MKRDRAGIHFLVDGKRIEPTFNERSLCCTIKKSTKNVVLASPASNDIQTADASVDTRILGLSLSAITVSGHFNTIEIPIDDPRLCLGFHPTERDGHTRWRWTSGHALIPASLWADCSVPVFLRIDLASPSLPPWITQAPPLVRQRAEGQSATALVLVPDPCSFDGSRGDQAMLTVIREALGETECFTLAFTEAAARRAYSLGFTPLLGGEVDCSTEFVLDAIDSTMTISVGADITDGSYTPAYPLKILDFLDATISRGGKAIIVGASFSRSPHPDLVDRLQKLDPEVTVCMRDECSLERFTATTGITARLVADAAFLLQPRCNHANAMIAKWLAAVKPEIVLGLNLHFLLFSTRDLSSDTTQHFVQCMRALSNEFNIAWMLLPHDVRTSSGDELILKEIHQALQHDLSQRIKYVAEETSCDQIKDLVSYCDGVVTGRMHLAIAALDRKVPVLCMDYKDKFEGLLSFFGLQDECLITNIADLDAAELTDKITSFIESLETFRRRISLNLPRVRMLASQNFEAMTEGNAKSRPEGRSAVDRH